MGAGSFSNTGNMCTAPKPANPTRAQPIPDRRSLGTSKTFTPNIKIIVLELLTSTGFDHVTLGLRALIEVGIFLLQANHNTQRYMTSHKS